MSNGVDPAVDGISTDPNAFLSEASYKSSLYDDPTANPPSVPVQPDYKTDDEAFNDWVRGNGGAKALIMLKVQNEKRDREAADKRLTEIMAQRDMTRSRYNDDLALVKELREKLQAPIPKPQPFEMNAAETGAAAFATLFGLHAPQALAVVSEMSRKRQAGEYDRTLGDYNLQRENSLRDLATTQGNVNRENDDMRDLSRLQMQEESGVADRAEKRSTDLVRDIHTLGQEDFQNKKLSQQYGEQRAQSYNLYLWQMQNQSSKPLDESQIAELEADRQALIKDGVPDAMLHRPLSGWQSVHSMVADFHHKEFGAKLNSLDTYRKGELAEKWANLRLGILKYDEARDASDKKLALDSIRTHAYAFNQIASGLAGKGGDYDKKIQGIDAEVKQLEQSKAGMSRLEANKVDTKIHTLQATKAKYAGEQQYLKAHMTSAQASLDASGGVPSVIADPDNGAGTGQPTPEELAKMIGVPSTAGTVAPPQAPKANRPGKRERARMKGQGAAATNSGVTFTYKPAGS